MNAADLIAFEREVAERFDRGEIPGPVHLAGGNEEQLIEIFKEVSGDDWVLCTYRSHFHALLHGVPRESLMARIVEGRSMNLAFPEQRFLTSAIVGGMLPIAVGIATAGTKVWCFVGDMAAGTGAFSEARRYADGHGLPVTFVIEDNGYATDTPTRECWGGRDYLPARPFYYDNVIRYKYERTYPHIGTRPHGAL